MISPYQSLSPRWQIGLCLVFVLLTMAYGRYLSSQGVVLNGKLTNGMLDLETPWSTTEAGQVLKRLGEEGIEHAKRLQLLDYVFLCLYPIALSLTCTVVASLLSGRLNVLGGMVAWGIPPLLFCSSAFRRLGFPEPLPLCVFRLLGMAYTALAVRYALGLQEARKGQGIVTNGGACLLLALYGLAGAWAEWSLCAKIYMWGSSLGAGAITAGLIWTGLLKHSQLSLVRRL